MKLLVIGGTSLDTLIIQSQKIHSAGGAGMYTAMAARCGGAEVSMFAPRPDPMPEELVPIAERLTTWQGPIVKPEALPHFEISHSGDRTTYSGFFMGAEADLDPELLPYDLSMYDCVHVVPLGNAGKQEEFILACLERGAKKISAGTFKQDVLEKPGQVRAVMNKSDYFFLNKEEALGLFESMDNALTSAGKMLFITLGSEGVMVVQGKFQTGLPAVRVQSLDPTGAGDAFCGATLAHLAGGYHPVLAARMAVALAAREVQHVGPGGLLGDFPAPEIALDDHIRIDRGQVAKVSFLVQQLAEASPSSFTGSDFPVTGDPHTIDFFFASILQQFGFWETKGGKYHRPLIAPIDGQNLKGSSYLFTSYMRALKRDPEFLTPGRQARLTYEELALIFCSDEGIDPMPATALHLELAQGYGKDMLSLGLIPEDILQEANSSRRPLKTFLSRLDHITGYKEDPLRKKANLLALCLNQRPERFLEYGEGEGVEPVIDYHTMRLCLRLGVLVIIDPLLRQRITDRMELKADEEWAVRYAAYRAVQEIVLISGKSLGAVDWFFFNYSRSHCPEMTPPDCKNCAADPVCQHRVDLFQPVYRTTFY